MEYEEIKLLKQSEKSTVLLVRETEGERVFVQKILRGKHDIYSELQNCQHPFLPKLYEVIMSDDNTTVVEEYIDGQSLGSTELSEKQLCKAIKELCSVLEFIHGKGIIHRDIKPSNIILATDGHIRLIDFDAARMPKDYLEEDTTLLGTRGFAPPEQYGFAQTDARADIYSLGVTLERLLGYKTNKPRYRRITQKCTNLNPDERYQSARQVKRAFSSGRLSVLYSLTFLSLIPIIWYNTPHQSQPIQPEGIQSVHTVPAVLPAPENPHWNGETGIGQWGNVPDSGVGGEVAYHWRMYRRDTATPPDTNESAWDEGGMRGNGGKVNTFPTYEVNLVSELSKNGFYYFAVCATGDGANFTDSAYVMSDAFEYTGESAPSLPIPTGLEWRKGETSEGLMYGRCEGYCNSSNQ